MIPPDPANTKQRGERDGADSICYRRTTLPNASRISKPRLSRANRSHETMIPCRGAALVEQQSLSISTMSAHEHGTFTTMTKNSTRVRQSYYKSQHIDKPESTFKARSSGVLDDWDLSPRSEPLCPLLSNTKTAVSLCVEPSSSLWENQENVPPRDHAHYNAPKPSEPRGTEALATPPTHQETSDVGTDNSSPLLEIRKPSVTLSTTPKKENDCRPIASPSQFGVLLSFYRKCTTENTTPWAIIRRANLTGLPAIDIAVWSSWPSADSAILWRILLLTVYFGLHYFMLSFGIWDSPVFSTPPPPPTISELLLKPTPADVTVLEQFKSFVHPHIDGHPHIHRSLSAFMRNGIGFAVAEWVALLWLSSTASLRRRMRLFGLLSAVTLFVNITGTVWGGLSHKTVLFPDVWGYLHQRLQSNFLLQKRVDILASSRDFSLKQFLSIWRDWRPLTTSSEEFPLPAMSAAVSSCVPMCLLAMYVLDVFGLLLSCLAACRFLKPRHTILPFAALIVLLGLGKVFLSGIPTPNARDHHWMEFRPHIGRDFLLPSRREPPTYISKYVKMPDGIEIAVDAYIPPHLIYNVLDKIDNHLYRSMYEKALQLPKRHVLRHSDTSITAPTLLIITRYNRRMTVRWPFTMISLWGQRVGSSTTNVWSWQFVDALVSNGYVVLVADTRGTGASFGQRPVDLSPSELSDFKKLRQWASEQFWYDSTIAAGGFSYDGMTGLHLAAMDSVQAVLALFTPVNVVHDLIQPGGLVCSAFVEDYTGLTMAFERSGTPRKYMLLDFSYDWQLTAGFLLTFGIAAPVKSREASLVEAIAQHQANWNMSSMVETIHFTDDFVVLPNPAEKQTTKIAVTQFGVTDAVVKAIGKSETAVYVVGGYCDASSVRGAARLFEALQQGRGKGKNELILGPWTHTGRQNCSPYSGGPYSHFEVEMYWDVLRFLDCHLRHRCWNSNNRSKDMSAPVHFWSVGEERWIASHDFPPTDVQELDLVFDATPTPFLEPRSLLQKVLTSVRNWQEATRLSLWKALGSSFRLIGTMVRESTRSFRPQHWPLLRILGHFYTAFQDQWDYQSAILERRPYHDVWDASYRLSSRVENDAFERSGPAAMNVDTITYDVDYNASTRGLSRWVIAKHPFRMQSYSYRELRPHQIPPAESSRFSMALRQFINFPFWSFSTGTSTGKMLMFSSSPLTRPIRIAGSPLVRFSLNLTEELARRAGDLERDFFLNRQTLRINELQPIPALDITVFGYLEDVDLAADEVHYVTEGRILLSHRPTIAGSAHTKGLTGLTSWKGCTYPPTVNPRLRDDATLRQKPRLGSADIVYQPGDRQAHHFTVGGVECVVFTFEPVVWYFRPGHVIRLSLVGADRANFRWSRTQSKEDADLLDHSLLSAVKAGGGQDKLREVRGRGIHVERPEFWKIPLAHPDHQAFLKLPILD